MHHIFQRLLISVFEAHGYKYNTLDRGEATWLIVI
jgi:hypothetical protein